MIEVRRKIRICDEQVWFTKIWNDNSNVNGNKLRLYRNFKKHLVPEHYVLNSMPRHLRSYICKLRCGTLPLVIETGRFNKPPIPLNEKTCPFCYNTVEDEVHFLIDCDIQSDLRLSLFSRATSIETIFCLKSNLDKFIFQINCNELRLELGGLLYNMIRRRRALLSNVQNNYIYFIFLFFFKKLVINFGSKTIKFYFVLSSFVFQMFLIFFFLKWSRFKFCFLSIRYFVLF